jgi:cytochrome c biogenesis protein
MLSVMMSYISHSQIWALQKGDNLYVGGRTNRAQVTFEREVIEILERLSEQEQAVEVPTVPAESLASQT